MKLTSWSHLVKPDRTILRIAYLSALCSGLAVLLVHQFTAPDQARMDRFGTALAESLATIAMEPLLEQNRLHLGVIGNRLVRVPEVAGVASYTADRQLLALAGMLDGPNYGTAVTVDETLIGHISVALDGDRFSSTGITGWRAAGIALALLLLPLLVASGWALAGAARRGEIHALTEALTEVLTNGWRRRAAPPEPAPPAAMVTAPLPVIESLHYLLAVNLYNQLSLQAQQRDFELSLCIEAADAIAARFQGRVSRLPGIGVLVDFEDTGDDDRPLQVVTAALLLGRWLRDEAPYGTYRLGLNQISVPGDRPPAAEDPAVADAALLSALAPELTLGLSEPVCKSLGADAGFETRPIRSPLLEELVTAGPRCRLLSGLTPEYQASLDQEVAALKSQRGSMASESTF